MTVQLFSLFICPFPLFLQFCVCLFLSSVSFVYLFCLILLPPVFFCIKLPLLFSSSELCESVSHHATPFSLSLPFPLPNSISRPQKLSLVLALTFSLSLCPISDSFAFPVSHPLSLSPSIALFRGLKPIKGSSHVLLIAALVLTLS